MTTVGVIVGVTLITAVVVTVPLIGAARAVVNCASPVMAYPCITAALAATASAIGVVDFATMSRSPPAGAPKVRAVDASALAPPSGFSVSSTGPGAPPDAAKVAPSGWRTLFSGCAATAAVWSLLLAAVVTATSAGARVTVGSAAAGATGTSTARRPSLAKTTGSLVTTIGAAAGSSSTIGRVETRKRSPAMRTKKRVKATAAALRS